VDDRILLALEHWEGIPLPERIPSRLPLLDQMRDAGVGADFSGVDLLVIQHQLATTVPLVAAFIEDGISLDRVWYVDIPYSTNLEVRTALMELSGRDRCPPLFSDPFADYSTAQLLRVTTTLLAMSRRSDARPLLVLDDGAYFFRALVALRAISHPVLEHFTHSFVVEQTTRGHRVLEANGAVIHELGLRVVSIARTKTKLELEAPFIGPAVAQSVAAKAQLHRTGRIAKMAILGFGIIGEASARALLRQFPKAELVIVEELPSRRATASGWIGESHVHQSLAEDHDYDLVVGCTGRNSFTLADRHLLADEAILASGSSAAVEFDRAGFVELADAYPNDEVDILDRESTRAMGIHADIRMRLERGHVATFMNAGFPVNFDGDRLENLPLAMIQPTRCLMYAGAEQSLRQSKAVVTRLDAELDDWIYTQGTAQLTPKPGLR
jgi:hypothetical protein